MGFSRTLTAIHECLNIARHIDLVQGPLGPRAPVTMACFSSFSHTDSVHPCSTDTDDALCNETSVRSLLPGILPDNMRMLRVVFRVSTFELYLPSSVAKAAR